MRLLARFRSRYSRRTCYLEAGFWGAEFDPRIDPIDELVLGVLVSIVRKIEEMETVVLIRIAANASHARWRVSLRPVLPVTHSI
jgi:hypothetical protein